MAESTECWCYRCDEAAGKLKYGSDPIRRALGRTRMNLCPDCGNKRCPRATHHDNACSGSNEPGQKGSIYE